MVVLFTLAAHSGSKMPAGSAPDKYLLFSGSAAPANRQLPFVHTMVQSKTAAVKERISGSIDLSYIIPARDASFNISVSFSGRYLNESDGGKLPEILFQLSAEHFYGFPRNPPCFSLTDPRKNLTGFRITEK